MRTTFKQRVRSIPVIGPALGVLRRAVTGDKGSFAGSEDYWISRYASGGDSGAGSYNEMAAFKARVLNDFVKERVIQSVIEYGCGDGNQLSLCRYPSYLGFDISPDAIAMCRKRFDGDPTKSFLLTGEYSGQDADLTLSLDVIFHLVEDPVFEAYMTRLFDSAKAYVIVYSSNTDSQAGLLGPHVRHRRFTDWVDSHKPEWKLIRHLPNEHPFAGDLTKGSFADFFIYEKAH